MFAGIGTPYREDYRWVSGLLEFPKDRFHEDKINIQFMNVIRKYPETRFNDMIYLIE
ncbi:MAG: hypothetical protein ACFE98_02090 [Candidatus Hermodarchaeota archaeon]